MHYHESRGDKVGGPSSKGRGDLAGPLSFDPHTIGLFMQIIIFSDLVYTLNKYAELLNRKQVWISNAIVIPPLCAYNLPHLPSIWFFLSTRFMVPRKNKSELRF